MCDLKMSRIVYYTMGNVARKRQIKECLRIINSTPGAVDRKVIICNNQGEHDRWSDDDLQELQQEYGAETYVREWNDSFVDARNAALEKCQHDDIIITSDPDEQFNELFIKDLRIIIQQLNSQKIVRAQINAHDITHPFKWQEGDETPPELISDHYKLLIFKYIPHTRYMGIGKTKNVHETLLPHDTGQIGKLDPKYYYIHFKDEYEIWQRASRNLFIGGGGNNAGEGNPSWLPLRTICKRLEINSWPDFDYYLKQGNIAQELKEWMYENRQNGFDYEEEEMNLFKYYFWHLFPKEKPEDIDVIQELDPDGLPAKYRIVEQLYLKIMGRHADPKGKAHYAGLLFNKTIDERQLEDILKKSPEIVQQQIHSRQLRPSSATRVDNNQQPDQAYLEQLNVNLPITVHTHLNESIISQILAHSEYWNITMKTNYHLGRKMRLYQGANWKVETQGAGTDEAPPENYDHYVQKVTKWIPPDKYPRMLEIGAGAGDETFAFKEAGYKMFGITNGKDNLKHAKEKYNIDLYEIDLHNLPFSKDLFDCAIVIHTFEHVYNEKQFLGELYYTLKPSARVYVAVPDPDAEASKTIWHVNLKYANQIIDAFAYWGFKCLTHAEEANPADENWAQYEFIFEKLAPTDPDFKNWNYLQHTYKERDEFK